MAKNVAIYARVSTESQNVKQQINYLKEWCKKEDYEVVEIVADEESARLPLIQRRKFLKLLDASKQGYFKSIIVSNLDRLTRNWDDTTLIEKHFRDNWNICNLISISDSLDLSNASGRLMFRIKMAFNCYYPEDMREKQEIGINRARKEGKYKYGRGRPKKDPGLLTNQK